MRRLAGWIGRLALILMGGVFLLAGSLKAVDPAGFTEQVAGYGIGPASLAPIVTYTLIPLEIAVGIALLLDFRRRWAVGLAAGLLVGFLGLMAWTWHTGGNVGECGCFGRFVERTPAETVAEDLGFLLLSAAGLMAPARGPGGRVRGGFVLAGALAAAGFLPLAPGLPLDGFVTGLTPGVKLDDLKLSLPDASLQTGTHLVALLALKEEASTKAADGLNALAAAPGAPAIAVIYADEEQVKDAFFWAHAPVYPMYQVVHGELRRLYRRLPRFFLLEDGVVKTVWETLPGASAINASATLAREEGRR
ncbi:MAG: DoxX family protein [Acidobacteria bacterium]|nr:DoxX family protein [Acidobacteriota bacterium]